MRVHAQSCPALCNSMDCNPPGSSVHGISRQEYWGRFPFPSPEDVPDPGIKAVSLASPALAGRFFPTEPPGKPRIIGYPYAAHFSILAWRIPWMEKPGRLQSMGSQRVKHD